MVVDFQLYRSASCLSGLRQSTSSEIPALDTFASQVLIWTVAADMDTEEPVTKNAVPWVVLDTPQKV